MTIRCMSLSDQPHERDSFPLPRCVGAWHSLPPLGPPHGRRPGTIAMSKKQTGTNNVFDEALEDFVESRRARARLPKNYRTLAASVRKKVKARESAVGRLQLGCPRCPPRAGGVHDDH